ncbi:F-box protein CPR30-like [Durio zibethinus]|uniref:F-box protein CPR30-like n=1 Tax=Durio zibethinus TaxID=66656 RepID=A0A6P5XSS0_DURZI|nr:F-box protein CPR30-like [Durio zibethinus]XP_022731254.1 F-box protein CPR30-like [Durio zibethinus]XP_022731255.1 F-box protein CPR30-like [Durio zibethinus]
MCSLSPDLIPEILCRVGVEDLLRFRCVSKPWCSLINSPDFIKLQLSYSLSTNTNLSLILRSSYLFSVNFDSLQTAQKLYHPLDENDEGEGTEILGSCNGLLALCNGEEEICLWNPSTRKSLMLPVTEIEFPPWFCCAHFIVYGLGYDPVSDDYKLVRMVQFYGKYVDSFASEVKVFSLKTNSWRRIKDFPFYLKYKRAYGILANNALHWVVSKKPESDTESFVVAFDLGTEEYRVVQLPDCLDKGFHMNVKALGGCLCMIANYWKPYVVDIWMMKEYWVKESWTKLLSVKQTEVALCFDFVLPLAYSRCGDKILLNRDDEKFVWYDLRRKRVKNVKIQGAPSSFEAEMLVGSLVPLNGNGAMLNKKKQTDKKKQKKNKKGNDFLSQGFHLVL